MFSLIWLLSMAALSLTSPAAAQPCTQCAVGDAPDALPGLGASAVPQLQGAVSGTIVGSGEYGLNVDPVGAGSLHHRLGGSLAGAVHVVPWLAIGLRVQGRYDLVSVGARSDDGLFGYPQLAVRLSAEPVAGLILGLDAQALVLTVTNVGSAATSSITVVAPSFELGSTSLLLRALGAYAVELGGARLVLALNLGYFLDNSRASAPRGITDNLSAEDQLSLGVSDTGAFVASLGAAYVTPSFEVFGEVSSRIYTDGSVLSSSPVRVGAGARIWFVPEVVFLGVGADVRVTAQSASLVASGSTNAPVEPAFGARLTLGVRIGAETPPGLVANGDLESEGEGEDDTEPEVVAATVGVARGAVTDTEGPIAGATVELVSDADQSTRTASTDAAGRWQIGEVPLGGGRYRITAEGRDPVEGTLTITAETPSEATSTMARSLPQGEIRGVIQASTGAAVAARIVIRPIDRELTADAEGSFAIEVPPGEYDVEVSAPGHRTQTRHVTVSERGVVVLNLQLRQGRRR